jgi:hypothetical protein
MKRTLASTVPKEASAVHSTCRAPDHILATEAGAPEYGWRCRATGNPGCQGRPPDHDSVESDLVQVTAVRGLLLRSAGKQSEDSLSHSGSDRTTLRVDHDGKEGCCVAPLAVTTDGNSATRYSCGGSQFEVSRLRTYVPCLTGIGTRPSPGARSTPEALEMSLLLCDGRVATHERSMRELRRPKPSSRASTLARAEGGKRRQRPWRI